ncbi:MAG: hypothetical protein OXD48_02340 [Litoreibacter sp.]|nr:hypothetical protein [Litoreibacter sp.]
MKNTNLAAGVLAVSLVSSAQAQEQTDMLELTGSEASALMRDGGIAKLIF